MTRKLQKEKSIALFHLSMSHAHFVITMPILFDSVFCMDGFFTTIPRLKTSAHNISREIYLFPKDIHTYQPSTLELKISDQLVFISYFSWTLLLSLPSLVCFTSPTMRLSGQFSTAKWLIFQSTTEKQRWGSYTEKKKKTKTCHPGKKDL